MGQYLPILALGVLATLFAGISFVAGRILNPPRPNLAKNSPYECGVIDQADPPERFPVRFYLIAMIFVVLDIEIIFLYPFTTVYGQLGVFGLLAVIEFSVAVFISFVYLISNGGLEWGPSKVLRRSHVALDADRTGLNTVRRVGLEGREPDESPETTEEAA